MSTPASPLQSSSVHGDAALPAWKQELNQRLREHRQRRGAEPASPPASARNRAASVSTVAARVAERYREAPSYRELLKASAEAAQASAQAAVSAAQCAAEAAMAVAAALPEPDLPPASWIGQPEVARSTPGAGFPVAVEHHTPLPGRPAVPERKLADRRAPALVDAFAEAVVPAAQSLPAKLIEFPRELVAPRRHRPRLAEGPLHDEQSPGGTLRIFEMSMDAPSEITRDGQARSTDPHTAALAGTIEKQARTTPPYATPTPMTPETRREPLRRAAFHWERAPERARVQRDELGWSPLELGAHPEAAVPQLSAARQPEQGYQAETAPLLQDLATVGDRLMAALVDASVVFACFLLSLLVFFFCTAHPPAGKAPLLVAALFLGVLSTFYGWLFLSFGGGSTPGMRYAGIALCTFSDENPTRRELQQRIPATALALLPLGLGVLWALLDEDQLGWQDRITRTYQRSYR